MTEIEGVIKYQLQHDSAPTAFNRELTELNAWRSIMYRLQLIGQVEGRYGGLGFGNISQRLDHKQFLITGTQTGHLPILSAEEYCLIQEADPVRNYIHSCGPCKPSSEALTHASVYHHNPDIRYVIHVHSPDIWRKTIALKIPSTAQHIPYGTPEMAAAVEGLLASFSVPQQGMFSMLGHEDGVVAFGKDLPSTAALLIDSLALAIASNQ